MTNNGSNTCPHCDNDHLYKLSDGRNKCSACGRKFSTTRRRSRLAADEMEAIVSGFACESPASTVAEETGLNLKTVHLYYGRIRELLAKEREAYLSRAYGSARISPDLFSSSGLRDTWRNAEIIGCLVDQESEMELLFAEGIKKNGKTARIKPSEVSGWLVAADRKALEELQLDRINCLPGKSAKDRARTFWQQAKQRLAAYCGGFKTNFHLYLREMEFRNNAENTEAARDQIAELLGQNSTTPTGEEDAKR